ncbi:hypothetical protein CEF21_03895 [Bacillus sp. FJAT-42376]|nr:hypothetical protein CEF21_03895 [Bacillus sp. FJAT-42376]
MSLFIKKLLAAILSSVLVSFLFSLYQNTFRPSPDPVSAFLDDWVFGLIYLPVFYILIGVPFAAFMDQFRSLSYVTKLTLYSLSGALLGGIVSFFLMLDGFPAQIIFYLPILAMVCSIVFLHIYMLLTKSRFNETQWKHGR